MVQQCPAKPLFQVFRINEQMFQFCSVFVFGQDCVETDQTFPDADSGRNARVKLPRRHGQFFAKDGHLFTVVAPHEFGPDRQFADLMCVVTG